jgi:large subunit ribosomal protein L5
MVKWLGSVKNLIKIYYNEDKMTSNNTNQFSIESRQELKKVLGLENIMAVPKLTKISLNMGLGIDGTDKKLLATAEQIMTVLGGRKPQRTIARKSVSSFKVRDGMILGLRTTLRKKRMYDFLDVLCKVAMPLIRDFRGISTKSFDAQGNYSIGIKDLTIFPGIDFESLSDKARGVDITFVTTAKNAEEALALLKQFGLPFKGQNK